MTRSSLLILGLVTALAAPAAAQEAKYRAPRTESGAPDLQGVWNFNTGVLLQRPAALGDKKTFTPDEAAAHRARMRNALESIAKLAPVEAIGLDWFDMDVHVQDLRTSLITYPANGRLPALMKGVSRMPGVDEIITLLGDLKGPPPPALSALLAAFTGGAKNSFTDFMPSERCIFAAEAPLVPQLEDNHIQIIQAYDTVVLVNDFQRRIISLSGKPAGGVKLNSGVSRGRWEGDTLVIETTNFDGKFPSFSGAGKSHNKVVTERITRTANNGLEYSATVVDPSTFQDKVEYSFPMALRDVRIHEGGCHEGNYSMRNSLSASRMADEAAAKAKATATPAK
ncbi:MAG TPA: hypothetical protein VM846_08400 [Vicinamibacterales bacterium]|nr:hypothetical protein [Vicinamibacterales bacterium]